MTFKRAGAHAGQFFKGFLVGSFWTVVSAMSASYLGYTAYMYYLEMYVIAGLMTAAGAAITVGVCYLCSTWNEVKRRH